jgi:sec-independent protein translocase protein TatA
MNGMFAFFLPGVGPMELLIVGLVVLLLFGNRLPSVMRSMGRGITEFKKGVKGIEDEIDDAGKLEDTGSIKGKVNREPFQK